MLHPFSQETDNLLVLVIDYCGLLYTTLCIASIYTNPDSLAYITRHAMLLQSFHCHILDLDMCVQCVAL